MTDKEIASTITSKGQVTIPAEVRRHLGTRKGSRVTFVLMEDGSVRLKAPRYGTVKSLRGAAGSLKKLLTAREMREIAYEDRRAAEQQR